MRHDWRMTIPCRRKRCFHYPRRAVGLSDRNSGQCQTRRLWSRPPLCRNRGFPREIRHAGQKVEWAVNWTRRRRGRVHPVLLQHGSHARGRHARGRVLGRRSPESVYEAYGELVGNRKAADMSRADDRGNRRLRRWSRCFVSRARSSSGPDQGSAWPRPRRSKPGRKRRSRSGSSNWLAADTRSAGVQYSIFCHLNAPKSACAAGRKSETARKSGDEADCACLASWLTARPPPAMVTELFIVEGDSGRRIREDRPANRKHAGIVAAARQDPQRRSAPASSRSLAANAENFPISTQALGVAHGHAISTDRRSAL